MKPINTPPSLTTSFCAMFELLNSQFAANSDPAIGRVLKQAAAAYQVAMTETRQQADAMAEVVTALGEAAKEIEPDPSEARPYESEMESALLIRNQFKLQVFDLNANAHRATL